MAVGRSERRADIHDCSWSREARKLQPRSMLTVARLFVSANSAHVAIAALTKGANNKTRASTICLYTPCQKLYAVQMYRFMCEVSLITLITTSNRPRLWDSDVMAGFGTAPPLFQEMFIALYLIYDNQ